MMKGLFLVFVIFCGEGVFGANPNYSYHVKIADPVEANYQEKAETRKGDYAEGFYSVVQPDGALRTVQYTADEWGFHPTVSYTYGHPVPQVKKVLVAPAQQPVIHSVPSVSYQQVYGQPAPAVGGGGYSYVNSAADQYAATYGTPVYSVKESRVFIKSPEAAAAAAAVLTAPHVQQEFQSTGGYSYSPPQKQVSYVQQEVAQPVVIAEPPRLEVPKHSGPVHVVQPSLGAYAQQHAQFTSEVHKLQDVQYVQQAPVVHQQKVVQYAPAPIVHQYIHHAPKKVQYVQPQVLHQKVEYVQQPAVQYLPPPVKVVETPAPPPVAYLPPTKTYLPPQKEVVVAPAVVEKPSNQYLPPPPAKVVHQAEYNVKYIPPPPQVQYVQQATPLVQKQVQYVQQVQQPVVQKQVQYVQQAAPVIKKQVYYAEPASVVQVHQHHQAYVRQPVPVQQVQYLQQPQVQVVHQQPQLQYVQQQPQVHYQYVQHEQPAIVKQHVQPAVVQHYAPQHMTYDAPISIAQTHQQILPTKQVVQKYEDIVVQNLDVMRYAAAPVQQFITQAAPAPVKVVTQLQTAAPAIAVKGKQNPLTFNYGYDTGVAKVSHSYFGSGW